MNLDEFFAQLKAASSEADMIDFCRRTVLHGTPKIFEGKEDDFYAFRKRIAVKWNVSFHEVYIVGSAKIGFSPFKRKQFDLNSDIDVAIVSPELFSSFMDKIYEYQMSLREARRAISQRELDLYHNFLEYAAIGWFRPDKLPLSFSMKRIKEDWFEFFESISSGQSEVGNYQVNAGVYKSYWHLENYAVSGIRDLKNSLEVGG